MEIRPASQDQKTWLRRELVASWREILLVLGVIMGYFIVTSILQALKGSATRYMEDLLTTPRMLHGLVLESAFLGLFLLFLHRRRWTTADLKIKLRGMAFLQGAGLFVAMIIGNFVTVIVLLILTFVLLQPGGTFLSYLMANNPHLARHSIDLSWYALVPAVVLNAYFEEIACMAYAFNQLAAKWGPYIALPVIVVLRMACHTYQGPIHATGVGVAFFFSGLVYCLTRNLWPLVFAHILLDLLSMGAIKVLFGR